MTPKSARSTASAKARSTACQEEITAYLVQLAQRELTLPQSRMIPVLTHCANDAERLADYAELVLKEAARLAERREKFSKKSEKELRTLFDLTGRHGFEGPCRP